MVNILITINSRELPVFPRISPYFPVFSRISPYFLVFPRISPYFPVFPRISPYFPVFPRISPYFPVFPRISPYLPVSPRISPYLPVSPRISPYLPVSPRISPYLPVSPRISPYLPVFPGYSTTLHRCERLCACCCVEIKTEASGGSWSAATSPARHHVPYVAPAGGLAASTSYPRLSELQKGGRIAPAASYSSQTTSMEAALGMSK